MTSYEFYHIHFQRLFFPQARPRFSCSSLVWNAFTAACISVTTWPRPSSGRFSAFRWHAMSHRNVFIPELRPVFPFAFPNICSALSHGLTTAPLRDRAHPHLQNPTPAFFSTFQLLFHVQMFILVLVFRFIDMCFPLIFQLIVTKR